MSPTTSYDGSYTVSWTDSSGGTTRAYLASRLNAGAWSKTLVTGTYSRAYSGMAVGNYGYKIQIYVWEAEIRQYVFSYETNVATVVVTTLSVPGAPGAITGPTTSSSGTYSLGWGVASGIVSRYELLENGVIVYSGTALIATVSGRLNGLYTYTARACNSAGCSALTVGHAVTVALSLTHAVEDQSVVDPAVPSQGWVGTIPGAPSVDGGAALYRIPIEVPPGRAGMQPELALAYSSRNGNGVAGVGWTLSGTSTIYRCPRTLANDGASAPVRLTDEDRLCMDGVRLFVVSGGHGQVSSKYSAEIDPFDRIQLQGAGMTSWSSWFKVEHKSGRISLYVPLRKDVSLPPDTWVLARQFDRQGNCVVYEYSRFGSARAPTSQEEWVLSSIAYTGTSSDLIQCTVGADARRVDFSYELREDQRRTSNAGAPTIMSARLYVILTRVGAAPVRKYGLSYRVSGATGRSLLQAVTLCSEAANDCVGERLPSTVFNYEEGPPATEPRAFAAERFADPDNPGVMLGPDWRVSPGRDYDGDGTRDMFYLQQTPSGWSRKLVLSACPTAPAVLDGTPWFDGFDSPLDTNPGRNGSGQDIDNDGRVDLIGSNAGDLVFASFTCQGWTLKTPTDGAGARLQIPTAATGTFASARDYDGDGLVDIVYLDATDSNKVKWYRHVRTSDESLVFDGPWLAPTVALQDGEAKQFEADFDGDGRLDWFISYSGYSSSPLTEPTDPRIAFLKSGASGLFYDVRTLGGLSGPDSWSSGEGIRKWMDINGDGLLDIYQPGMIWLNRGGEPASGMFRTVSVDDLGVPLVRDQVTMVMDFDSDGIDELMVPTTRVIDYCGGDPDRKLPSGDPYFWCGDDFDLPGANPSYDKSVFLWDAYELRERSDGTFTFVRVPTNLRAPIRYSQTVVDDFGANAGSQRPFGDGMQDVGYRLVNHYEWRDNKLVTLGYYMTGSLGPYVSRNLGQAPDLLKSVTNGLGATAAWTHQPLSQAESSCDPSGAAFYSVNHEAARTPGYVFFTSSMWAVASFDADNGLATMNRTCHRYVDAMLNVEGRGFQGFKTIVAEERLPPAAGEVAGVAGTCGAGGCSTNNLRTTTEFNQEFPLTNRVKKVTVERASDGRLLSETRQWWHAANGSWAGTRVVYPSATVEEEYDLAAGSLISTIKSVEDQVDALSGEARRSCGIVEDETRPVSDTRRMTVAQEDRVLVNDTSVWWLAKITSGTKTSDFRSTRFTPETCSIANGVRTCVPTNMPVACPPLPATSNVKVQRATYVWPWGDGAPAGFRRKLGSEAVFPGATGTIEEARTDYPASGGYDQYGNVARRQVTARDVLDALGNPKTLVTTYTTSADGYFTNTETNAAGHVSTVVADPATGQPTYRQAIQGGPVTTTQYDGLGRVLTVTTDGTKPVEERHLACATLSALALPPCSGQEAMARAVYQAGAPARVEYLDVLGRAVRSASEGFDGSFVVETEVTLNERGIKVAEYAPRWLGAAASETRHGAIDAMGRVGRREVDRNAGLFAAGQGETTLATDYVHQALTTSITVHKPAAQGGELQMSRTYDARGKLVETAQRVAGVGSSSTVTQYLYDPAGALTNIRSGSRRADGSWAVNPATIDLVATYDHLGRKTSVQDPDRGVWTYTWDGLGRLRTQTDARGNVTTQEYDDIGRPKERTSTANGENPLHAAWTWDQGQKGVLNRLDGNDGYAREYRYDSLLRPEKVITTLPEMDAIATSSRVFAVEYGYDRGTGRLKAKRYPNVTAGGSETVVLDYNGRGFLLGETELLANYTRGRQYRHVQGMDARGEVTLQDLGNGVVETTGRDASTGLVLDVQATKSGVSAPA